MMPIKGVVEIIRADSGCQVLAGEREMTLTHDVRSKPRYSVKCSSKLREAYLERNAAR